MGNRRLYKAECIHTLGTPEYERLKVAALNLFHPTAPSLSQELVSLYCDTTLRRGERSAQGQPLLTGREAEQARASKPGSPKG